LFFPLSKEHEIIFPKAHSKAETRFNYCPQHSAHTNPKEFKRLSDGGSHLLALTASSHHPRIGARKTDSSLLHCYMKGTLQWG
jgi:hypothetical protein